MNEGNEQFINLRYRTKDNINSINTNKLTQSQQILKNNNDNNPLRLSISDKIKLMKEELCKENNKPSNNNFKLRLEKLSKRKNEFEDCKKQNGQLNNKIYMNSMKNKLENFGIQKKNERIKEKNNFDELEDMMQKFKIKKFN